MSVVVQVPVAEVVPSPWQTRRQITDASVRELADSIEETGLLQPVVTRELEDGRHELLAGHRRHRAHQLLQAETIDAHVLDGISDAQAREIVLVENAQRQDVTPLEEAELIRQLVEGGRSAQEVAARLGKAPSYVHGRLRLAGLIEPLKKHLEAGEITLTLALRIARLEDPAQKSAARSVRQRVKDRASGFGGYRGEVSTAPAALTWSDVSHDISGLMLPLASAPFPTDVELAKAPACTECPKRTGAQSALFSDGIESEDRCTDAKCWKRKVAAHWRQLRKEHKAAGGTVLGAKATYGKNSPVFVTYYGGDTGLSGSAPYVELYKPISYGSKKTWGELLEGELDPSDLLIAKVGDRIYRLAPKAKAEAVKKAKGPKEKPRPVPDWEKKRKAEAKKRREENKLKKAVFTKVADQVAIIAKRQPVLQLEDVAGVALGYLRRWDPVETKGMTVAQALVAVMTAKLLGRHNKALEEEDRKLAELLGVDVGAIEDEVDAAARAKQKRASRKRSRKAKG